MTTLSTIHLFKEKMLRVVFWHPVFGDLSQSEKLSEIKPPLVFSRERMVEVLIFFIQMQEILTPLDIRQIIMMDPNNI